VGEDLTDEHPVWLAATFKSHPERDWITDGFVGLIDQLIPLELKCSYVGRLSARFVVMPVARQLRAENADTFFGNQALSLERSMQGERGGGCDVGFPFPAELSASLDRVGIAKPKSQQTVRNHAAQLGWQRWQQLANALTNWCVVCETLGHGSVRAFGELQLSKGQGPNAGLSRIPPDQCVQDLSFKESSILSDTRERDLYKLGVFAYGPDSVQATQHEVWSINVGVSQ
jgi:hypothetical protein